MPYQPQPPMDANNTPGLAPRAQLPQNIEAEQSVLARLPAQRGGDRRGSHAAASG